MDEVPGAPLSQLLPGAWFIDRVHSTVHANLQYSLFTYIKFNHCFMSHAILPLQPLSYIVFIPAVQIHFLFSVLFI
jgi:hypothetical protein